MMCHRLTLLVFLRRLCCFSCCISSDFVGCLLLNYSLASSAFTGLCVQSMQAHGKCGLLVGAFLLSASTL